MSQYQSIDDWDRGPVCSHPGQKNTVAGTPHLTAEPFTMLPAVHRRLPVKDPRGLLSHIIDRIFEKPRASKEGPDGAYLEETDLELGEQVGKSPVTIGRWLRALRESGSIECPRPYGKRRIYPTKGDGKSTVPAHVWSRGSVKNDDRSHQKRRGGGRPPTKKTARVVSVEKALDQRIPPTPLAKAVERERSESGLEGGIGCIQEPNTQSEVDRPQVQAPAPAEVSPPPPAPAPVQGEPEIPAETPIVRSWADLVTEKPEAKKSDEERLLEFLTPEERVLFQSLPLSRRCDLRRGFFQGVGGRRDEDVRYLKRELARSTVEAPPPLPPAETVSEMILRIPAANLAFSQSVAQRIANLLKDAKYLRGLEQLMAAIWQRTVDARQVASAYQRAVEDIKGKHIRKPGAYLWKAIRRETGIKGPELRDLAEPARSHH